MTDISFRGPVLLGVTALVLLVAGVGTWVSQATLAGAIVVSGQIEVEDNRRIVQHPMAVWWPRSLFVKARSWHPVTRWSGLMVPTFHRNYGSSMASCPNLAPSLPGWLPNVMARTPLISLPPFHPRMQPRSTVSDAFLSLGRPVWPWPVTFWDAGLIRSGPCKTDWPPNAPRWKPN